MGGEGKGGKMQVTNSNIVDDLQINDFQKISSQLISAIFPPVSERLKKN